jgi:hypothetical protein
LALDQLIEQHGDSIALIRYQMGTTNPFFMYDSLENRTRISYYGVGGSGHLYIDGVVNALYDPAIWDSLFDTRLDVPSPMEIQIWGSYSDFTRRVDLDIGVIATDSIGWSDLRLQCVLIENHIHYNAPNGLLIHNQIMRDMVPDALGEQFSISNGDTVFFERTFTVDRIINVDSSEVVVFTQDHRTKNMIQAAKVGLRELEAMAVRDEPRLLPRRSKVNFCQPNPFNAKTIIKYSLSEESNVAIGIYNILGKRIEMIRPGSQRAGDYGVIWDASALPSGVYFARLETGRNSQSLKMLLIK